MSQNDPDYPAIVLASYMFGEPITSRILGPHRNREGLITARTRGFSVPAEGDAAMLSARSASTLASVPRSRQLHRRAEEVWQSGFTAAEVADAKKAYADARTIGRSTDAALLSLLASHEQLGSALKWDADLEAKIQALTVDQINAAFRKHIDPNGVSIVKAGDFKTAGVFK
jgi:zinc protease